MKLVCGVSSPFHSKGWPFGSKVPFLFSSLLFSLLVAHASSLVLGSEVVILVFFTILNDYKYEKTTTNMRQ